MRYYHNSDSSAIAEQVVVDKTVKTSLLARSFVYMFLGLLITGAVALGLGYLFLVTKTMDTAGMGVLIGCSIGVIIMSFVNSLVLLKGNHSLVVPCIIYALLMGGLLSGFVGVGISPELLSTAFLISAGVFGLMALIGILSKGNLNMLALMAIGLVSGAALLSLVFLIVSLFTNTFNWMFFWIDMAIFVAMMLFTIFDINQIAKISKQGENSTNLALYCAMTLYTDFIYIFVKILYFLLLIFGKR